VPKTDSDGNDIAGVRLVDVTVPLATYTGWGLRSGPQASDGCESTGQYIPFAKTPADLVTPNGTDPRPSVVERYPTFSGYYTAVVNAINTMVSDRLLLCEDVATELDRLSQAGVAAGVPPREAATGGRRAAALPVPSCMSGQ
jgi:Alpha/beta hydrolase domain